MEAFPSTKRPYPSRTVELAKIEEFCIWISVLPLIWIPLAKFFSKSRWPMRTSSIRTSRAFSISTPNRWTSAPIDQLKGLQDDRLRMILALNREPADQFWPLIARADLFEVLSAAKQGLTLTQD